MKDKTGKKDIEVTSVSNAHSAWISVAIDTYHQQKLDKSERRVNVWLIRRVNNWTMASSMWFMRARETHKTTRCNVCLTSILRYRCATCAHLLLYVSSSVCDDSSTSPSFPASRCYAFNLITARHCSGSSVCPSVCHTRALHLND